MLGEPGSLGILRVSPPTLSPPHSALLRGGTCVARGSEKAQDFMKHSFF